MKRTTQLSLSLIVLAAGLAHAQSVTFDFQDGTDQGFGTGFGNRTAGYLGPDPATVGREYVLLRPHTHGGDLVLAAPPAGTATWRVRHQDELRADRQRRDAAH